MSERQRLRKALLARRGSITALANRLKLNKGRVSMALKSDEQRCGIEADALIIAACREEVARLS